MSDYSITADDIAKFLLSFETNDDWVSARNPFYPVYTASKAENRYNREGEVAYYLASGDGTMKAEIPNWIDRDIYKVAPSTINAFDLAGWSLKRGFHEDFLKSKTDGGYGLCQAATEQLTGIYGVTGILYNSQPRHAVGETGICLVLMPSSGQLVDGKFFIKT
ncbi:hypothetical protein BH09VER1_BH09VER1_29820 [soil metagenome]